MTCKNEMLSIFFLGIRIRRVKSVRKMIVFIQVRFLSDLYLSVHLLPGMAKSSLVTLLNLGRYPTLYHTIVVFAHFK